MMRPAGEKSCCNPNRSTKVWRKVAGGSGRIPWAGGKITAWRTDINPPTKAAPPLTNNADITKGNPASYRKIGKVKKVGINLRQTFAEP